MQVLISDHITLASEPIAGGIRLVLKNSDIELACRKENLKNLSVFLSSENPVIFKGRLQLLKQDGLMIVMFKGKPVGSLTLETFDKLLAV